MCEIQINCLWQHNNSTETWQQNQPLDVSAITAKTQCLLTVFFLLIYYLDIRVCHPNADSYRDLSPKKSTGFMKMKRSENTTSRHRNRARHIHPTGICNDGSDGWRMPVIPLKINRATICKKARELRHNNFMGQGESVLCNFVERAPMPKGIENPEKEELRC